MRKNPIKSLIKSIVRTLWKYLLSPIFVKPLPNGKPKAKLQNIGYRIEHRLWWPKTPKPNQYIAFNGDFKTDSYLLEELTALGKIEFDLQPTPFFLASIHNNQCNPSTKLEPNSLGEVYGLILRHLNNLHYDVIFLAPWLKRGGADLGLLHHINAVHEKNFKILLITTENANSPWIDRLPASVKHLDFGKFAVRLQPEKRVELLARILIQSTAQTIHNINSRDGWEVFKNFGTQLGAMGKCLFASVFCDDIISKHTYFGYAPKYMPETHAFLSGVFCDTQWYPKIQSELLGIPHLFSTVYFPFAQNIRPYRREIDNSAILWASRITQQKRPEILYEIAKQMPHQVFHAYGEPDTSGASAAKSLKNQSNINFFGKFDSFTYISQKENYKAFLYTSEYDGLPNVLIEAIASGLPVIAYDVGGVGELIHTDCLLSHSDTFEENLQKIRDILDSPELLYNSWKYSHDILKSRHSWTSFVNTLEQTKGYFPTLSQEEYWKKYYSNPRVLSKPDHESV